MVSNIPPNALLFAGKRDSGTTLQGLPKQPNYRRRTAALIAASLLAAGVTVEYDRVSFVACSVKNGITKPEFPKADVTRPQLAGPQSTEALQRLQQLQPHKPLHGVNTPKALAHFEEKFDYTAFDVDIDFDPERQEIVAAHDNPNAQSPLFWHWLENILAMPADKAAVIKLDVKDRRAIEPLIRMLKSSQDKHPEQWEGRHLILNGDIPLGETNERDSYLENLVELQNPGSTFSQPNLRIEDLLRFRKAFPNAIISFGGLPPNTDSITPDVLERIENTMQKIGSITTVAFNITTELTPDVFETIEKNNGFVTIWGEKMYRDCASNASFKVPENYRNHFWLDF